MKKLTPLQEILYELLNEIYTFGHFMSEERMKNVANKIMKLEEDKEELFPKTRNVKHYRLWSRKGTCPSCHVGCGSKHREHCKTREDLLRKFRELTQN